MLLDHRHFPSLVSSVLQLVLTKRNVARSRAWRIIRRRYVCTVWSLILCMWYSRHESPTWWSCFKLLVFSKLAVEVRERGQNRGSRGTEFNLTSTYWRYGIWEEWNLGVLRFLTHKLLNYSKIQLRWSWKRALDWFCYGLASSTYNLQIKRMKAKWRSVVKTGRT